jgi:MFS family permease
MYKTGSAPYAPVLRNARVRRLLPGFATSFLGDGMSAIAVAWLAIEIAPPDRHSMWVSLAIAAYTFPAVIGTFALARLLRRRGGAQLVTWDATLRGLSLGAIAIAAAMGVLNIWLLVTLLALSSVLHSWGSAGVSTLLAELLPERDHLPANALLGMLIQTGTLIGPLVAGLLIDWHGAGWVIGLDAVTFLVLAASCRFGVPRRSPAQPGQGPSRATGLRVLLADPRLLWLLLLTFGFYALYGPIEVGLPIYVADYQHAPAAQLAWYFTAFGAGAVAGGLAAGYMRDWPLWPTVSGIVIGVGVAFLPLGLGAPTIVAVASLAVAGFICAPYGSITVALFQRSTTPDSRAQVLAARSTVMIIASQAGVGLGGVLVTTAGVLDAMLFAAVGTIALGMLAVAGVGLTRNRTETGQDEPELTRGAQAVNERATASHSAAASCRETGCAVHALSTAPV